MAKKSQEQLDQEWEDREAEKSDQRFMDEQDQVASDCYYGTCD